MSERAPTPEQAAAIEIGGRDVLLEAGAGTGKTGVMVDRYCRLVCDEGVAPDAILAFTFTDKAAAELRQRIRAELARRAEAGSERAARAAGRDRRRLGDDDPRLLQPAARRPPGRGRDRPRLPRPRRPRGRAGRPRGLRRSPRRVPRPPAMGRLRSRRLRPIGPDRGRNWWRPTTSTGCGGSSSGSTPSCAAAARRSRGCRSRRPSDPAEAIAAAIEAAGQALEEMQRERSQAGAGRAGAGAARASPGRRPGSTSCGRCAPTARRRRSSPTARRSTRRSHAPPRPAREARPTATWPTLLELFSTRFEAAKERRAGIDFEDLQILAARLLERAEIGEAYRDPLQPPAGRRVPGHQPPAAAADRGAARAAQRAGRGRRRVPVDLRLPPRRPRRLPPPAPTWSQQRADAELMELSGNFRSRPELIAAVNLFGAALLGDVLPAAAGRAPPANAPAGRGRRSSCC